MRRLAAGRTARAAASLRLCGTQTGGSPGAPRMAGPASSVDAAKGIVPAAVGGTALDRNAPGSTFRLNWVEDQKAAKQRKEERLRAAGIVVREQAELTEGQKHLNRLSLPTPSPGGGPGIGGCPESAALVRMGQASATTSGISATVINPSTAKSLDPLPPTLAPVPAIGQTYGGIEIQGPTLNTPDPVKVLPLSLIEEMPKPPQLLTEIELIMKAWSEEQAKAMFILTMFVRFTIGLIGAAVIWLFWRSYQAGERRLRGGDNMPSGLRIGSVVYFDMTDNGRDGGRIVIGLLNENCPLYCEYFHRRCTGSGANGDSFRGMSLGCLLPRSVALFGDGHEMKHNIDGYNEDYLPTEWLPNGPWRGCLSSIAYAANKESPNFAIHLSAGDFTPQVFGVVIGGFDVIEKMSEQGTSHGCAPKHEWVIDGCGELCTLDKANVQPLPWRLFETVSNGYDEAKYGRKACYADYSIPEPEPPGQLRRPRMLHPVNTPSGTPQVRI